MITKGNNASSKNTFEFYPTTRDSGIEIFGKIPVHWKIEKLKYGGSIRFSNVNKKTDDAEISVRLCNYIDVYYNDLITPEIDFMQATATPDEIRKFQLKKGDIIVTKDSEDWKDIAIPSYLVSDIPNLICGYHLALIRLDNRKYNGKFMFWLLNSECINYQYKVAATGVTRYGLSNYSLSNSLVLAPPLIEQEKIVSFLDPETAIIDSLISKKQKLILLLQEKRQALITQTVTKGLNLNGEMKESGVEWMGRIPEHWKLDKIKHQVRINQDKLSEYTLSNQEIKYIDIGSVDSNGKITNIEELFFVDAPSRARRLVNCGDSIISTVRTYLKSIAFISEKENKNICSTGFAVLTPSKNISPKFLFYWMRSSGFIDEISARSVGVSYPAINPDEIGTLPIPLLPLPEQRQIEKTLNREMEQIDNLEEKIKLQIEKLCEYRQALISAAVTGKIDVRREPVPCP